jgi:hypothetical protein
MVGSSHKGKGAFRPLYLTGSTLHSNGHNADNDQENRRARLNGAQIANIERATWHSVALSLGKQIDEDTGPVTDSVTVVKLPSEYTIVSTAGAF